MRRISKDSDGAWVDHVWYPDKNSADCLAAQDALDERRRARRARLLALVEDEDEDCAGSCDAPQ